MKLSELAAKTGARVEGDASIEIEDAAGLDQAGPGQVTFLANPRYTSKVQITRASAIYVGSDVDVARNDIAILRAKDPYLAYTRAMILFHPRASIEAYVHPSAVIDQTACVPDSVSIGVHSVIGRNVDIGERVRIHANATIYDNVTIGDDTEIHSGVSIRENSIVGKRVIIHNNAVIGSDGFGFAKDEQRHWLKIPQTGRVVIEDDVEIGAGTTHRSRINRRNAHQTRSEVG